jgi:hypothetical protein
MMSAESLAPAVLDHLTSTTVVRLMRLHGKTIAGLADAMNITQSRVRDVRDRGINGVPFVQDWMQAITGDPHAGWDVVARAYL